MLLSQLLKGFSGATVYRDKKVSGISHDSRKISKGDLFVAISGYKFDGHAFISDAVSKGASAVVAERLINVPPDIGLAVVSNARLALSHISSIFYDNPSKDLLVVGITGTKGKTTTCHMVKSVLDAGGERTGLIGSVHNIVGDEVRPVTRTTPESLELHKLQREMVDKGCTAVCMEVSSHALALHRVSHIQFDIALFTNIGRDHLDFHGTMENYVKTKAKFFEMVSAVDRPKETVATEPFCVINADDPYSRYFSSKTRTRVISYGFSPEADVRAEDVSTGLTGSSFTVLFGGRKEKLFIHLPGKFNIINALSACAVGFGLSIDKDKIFSAVSSLKGVPGRAEVIPLAEDFSVWVDYAHTPESLRNILTTARDIAEGRVIAVFGCGGERDKGKRPLMGKVAAEICDVVIITNDNPRSEDEDEILDQIEEGIKASTPRSGNFIYKRIKDRREAIREAVRIAQKGDIVVLAGKGHETYQVFKDKTVYFDDSQEARKAVMELRY